jgi:hypothetical protein
MRKDAEHILISANWRDRKLTAREFIDDCYRFLNALKDISPAFSNRCTAVGDEFDIVPDDYVSFEEVMTEALADPDSIYNNPDPALDSFTLDSTISGGFSIAFSESDPKATIETAISIKVRAGAFGSPRSTANVLIELPPLHASLVENDRIARKLLDVLIDIWRPEFATIYSDELLDVLDPDLEKKRACGALMYFADTDPATVIGNTGVVETARTGGIVVRIPASPPWARSADAFRPCFERLSNAGFLK